MNQHDIELLSTYLDGGLKPSDSARLESRLASDPSLASTLDAMRASRALLRRMPKRRAPRNFMLTRKMVGLKPPLPRSYPVFKFATAFAAFLFFLSFFAPRAMSFGAAAPAPVAYEMLSAGADAQATEESFALQSVPAAEAPALTEPAPLPTEMANAPLEVNPESNGSRIAEDASAKSAPASAPPLIANWQVALGVVALLGAATMLALRFLAARKWR